MKNLKWKSISLTKLTDLIKIVETILIVHYFIMFHFFIKSGDDVSLFASQLSFNPAILRAEYTHIDLVGGMQSYKIAQGLDYIFMILYSILLFSLCQKWARIIEIKAPERKSLANVGYLLSILVFIAAIFDAMENLFIFKMLSYAPTYNFPGEWAIIHSSFALVKWIILFCAIGWYIYAYLGMRPKLRE